MSKIPTQETLTVGGRVFTDLKNLKILQGIVAAGAAANTSYREPNATVGYTPSGVNNFRVLAVRTYIKIACATSLLYTNNDMGIASSTAPVSPVNMNGDTYAAQIVDETMVAGQFIEMSVNFLIPNSKYPGSIRITGSGSDFIQIFGYEEAP